MITPMIFPFLYLVKKEMILKKITSYFNCLICFILLQIILIPAAGAANKFMPVGDSVTQGITSGVADEEFQVSYRKALYDKLKAAGYVINDEIFVGTLFSGESVTDFDPDHEGHPGWRADQIVDGRVWSPGGGQIIRLVDCRRTKYSFITHRDQ
jgi:hypothetical protein